MNPKFHFYHWPIFSKLERDTHFKCDAPITDLFPRFLKCFLNVTHVGFEDARMICI